MAIARRTSKEKTMQIDHEFRRDCFVCPHCGYKFSDCWEWPENGERECDDCENKFSFTQDFVVYYSTEKLIDDHGRMGKEMEHTTGSAR